MSDLSAVLGYLADVADADMPQSFFVDDVVFTGVRPLRFDHKGPTKQLERLQAIDVLHKEELLLRRGRLWIVGEIESVRYRWPIEVERTVRIYPDPLQNPSWTIPAGLIHPPELTAIALEERWGGWWLSGFATEAEAVEQYPQQRSLRDKNRKEVNSFVQRYLREAGLPPLEIITGTEEPPPSEPAVMVSNGNFLERHPLELVRGSVLRLWRFKDLEETVLASLYADATEADKAHSAPADDRPVQSPLPLNDRQRQAVTASRTTPLTVVSGPPGTGKSHLVAATAIDRVADGGSVLIATQSVHASDVIADMLARYPMVETLRFGDEGSIRRLSDKLSAGIAAPDDRHDIDFLTRRCDEMDERVVRQTERLASRIQDLGGFEAALARKDDLPLWLAQRDLDAIQPDALRRAAGDLRRTGLLGRSKRRSGQRVVEELLGSGVQVSAEELDDIADAIEAEQLVGAVAGRDLGLDEMWESLDHFEEQWRQTIGELLEARRRTAARAENRGSLNQLASALRLEPLERREAFLTIGPEFLHVVPLWIGTLEEIESVLPVEPGLFDLVILDEASQISQLSAVPALARAKRAMIVGDTRQLRHQSTASRQVQTAAADEHELSPLLRARLDDRTNSAFDAATGVAQVIALDEHFRSAPHIIGFSDQRFYEGKLRLMTQHPSNESRDAIEIITVAVEQEVAEVISQVRSLMESGEDSIGVVSPLQAQAAAVENAMIDAFTLEEIDRHRLRAGTVENFQGTERDHIIISLGLRPGQADALALVEDPAVFNVMVTRARKHIVVITALTRDTAGSGLLGQYLQYADEPPSPRRGQVHATGWAERVATDLAQQTAERVITDYEVAGETIDVVVGSGSNAFGIETEMHPGGAYRHIDRRLALRRAGWDIVSLHRASCLGREEEAITEVLTRATRVAGPAD